MVQKIRINKSGVTQFPTYLQHAHDLCFLNHDVLVEFLRSGEESKVFFHRIPLIDDNDRELLKEADDIFSWLETTNRVEERTELLKRVVFPALLSDFLHFTYEALECSRKGKLTVSYDLIRKPLQENLFLFEVIAAAKYDFATWLVENPLKLRARHAGGLDAHIKRIGLAFLCSASYRTYMFNHCVDRAELPTEYRAPCQRGHANLGRPNRPKL